MKLSFAAIVGALVATVCAKPAFTNTAFDVQEGQPFTLTWTNATGPVTLVLVTGPSSQALNPVETLASGVTVNSFTFTPTGLPSGNYAFRISDPSSASDPNYSVLFPYVGTGSSSSSVSRSTVTSVSTTVSTSATATTTSSAESTTTERTSTSTRTTATTTSRQTSAPTNNNNAQRFSSPLALVIITAAALVFFN